MVTRRSRRGSQSTPLPCRCASTASAPDCTIHCVLRRPPHCHAGKCHCVAVLNPVGNAGASAFAPDSKGASASTGPQPLSCAACCFAARKRRIGETGAVMVVSSDRAVKRCSRLCPPPQRCQYGDVHVARKTQCTGNGVVAAVRTSPGNAGSPASAMVAN
jgi:hypothetical protein